jgi:hypothetical protein
LNMRELFAIAATVVISLVPLVAAHAQSLPQLRHDQIKNEQKAERDMAHGDYRAARQHQRRAQADDKVRQAEERQQLERERRHHWQEGP